MEHKASNTDNPLASFFTTEEIELSRVLLQLAYPVSLSEYRRNVSKVRWGSSRKRSIPFSEPPVNGPNATATATTSPPAAAPVCCRPPSRDAKPKSSKRRRRRRREQYWVEKINELTERREVLNREVGKVRAYCEKLKAINSALKARKQELSSCRVQQPITSIDCGCFRSR